ncbi:hypothetical protein ABGB17_28510 [Sphaerisporangium sp. B11E5]|uniref:hypothetical protein n=1 Tax=Sphaerisporangium sp. B11E5 TaxID=3153563 RepID=UPI00325D3723
MNLDEALAGTPAATSRAEADAETAQIDAVRIWAADSVRVLPGADPDDDTGERPTRAVGTGDAPDTGDTVDVGKELKARIGGSGDAADVINALKAARGAAPAETAGDAAGGAGAETADSDTTANVRRPAGAFPSQGAPDRAPVPADDATAPAGFLRRRPYASPGAVPPRESITRVRAGEMPGWPEPMGDAPPARPAGPPRRSGPLAAAIQKVGDVPIRVVYGVCAAVVTGVIVVIIFALFSGDRPEDPMRVSPAQGGGVPSPGASAKPSPSPIAVPPVPAAKAMTVFDGPGTPIASYVLDRKAGLSYAQYAGPWARTTRAPFSAAQKVGSAARPQTLIASAPLPGSLGEQPQVYSDFRALAGRAAKWTLRHQPAGATFTWTASQRARYGVGWMLGYKLTYRVNGKKHTSQTYVMVIATGRAKPAMLFATVPDTRAALYRDLNMLFWTVRPI